MPTTRCRSSAWKLDDILRESPLWDGKVGRLQVTNATQETVELRALMSARNSSQAFDLRCEVREKLIAFLQAEYPYALPRQRWEVASNHISDPATVRPFVASSGH